MRALGEQVAWDWRYGYVLLPAGLVAAGLRRSPRAVFLVTVLAVLAVVWLGFTHLQSRFFVPAIPAAGLLIAEGRGRRWVVATSAACLVLLACTLVPIHRRLSHYLDLDRQVASGGGPGLLGRENLAGLRPLDPAALPPGTRVDLVGDAGPFLYQTPTPRLRYRTVFDVDAGDGRRSVVEDWLAGPATPEAGRVIVVDPGELRRLSRTYYAIPPLTDEELRRLAERKDVVLPGR